MKIQILFVAIVMGFLVSLVLVPRLSAIFRLLQLVMAVLWKVIWLALLLITAVSLFSFWDIGWQFSGLSLITAVTSTRRRKYTCKLNKQKKKDKLLA